MTRTSSTSRSWLRTRALGGPRPGHLRPGQNWLIGFSKSGYGGQDLLLKHPDLFAAAATWDFPADMSSYDDLYSPAANYGTEANFTANYQLTEAFVTAHKTPFQAQDRIWFRGYSLYEQTYRIMRRS